MTPLLEVLRDHGELDRHTAADLVVRHMGLTPEQIALSHETSGKSVIKGRIAWASSGLKSCGALIQPKKAHSKLRVIHARTIWSTRTQKFREAVQDDQVLALLLMESHELGNV